jgi:sphinganine-1-phosphate aldolase
MGKEGYLESCRSIVGAAKRLEKAIREEIPELEVLGKPLVSVVAFKDKKGMGVNIYQLGDYLSSKGWHREFFCLFLALIKCFAFFICFEGG